MENNMKTIEGAFYNLIVKGATVVNSKTGSESSMNFLIDIRKVDYTQQLANNGRKPSFLRIENNRIVTEYYCSMFDAKKIFSQSVIEERVWSMRNKEINKSL